MCYWEENINDTLKCNRLYVPLCPSDRHYIPLNYLPYKLISYFNHEAPPTEENFIDFLGRKKESGRTLQYIAELYATLCKVAWHQWRSFKKTSQLWFFFLSKNSFRKVYSFIWLSSKSSNIGHKIFLNLKLTKSNNFYKR